MTRVVCSGSLGAGAFVAVLSGERWFGCVRWCGGGVTGEADSVTAGELVRRTIAVRTEAWYSSRHRRRAAVAKGVDIEIAPLDEEHVRVKITWSEQDVGGGKLVVEVTVKNMKTHPKTDEQLRSDAKALAVRFARAFADTIEN